MDFVNAQLFRLLSDSGVGNDVQSEDDKWLKCSEAFGWGILSASSLVLGAAVGIVKLPSKVVRAALMAFGGGALIEALSIELFAHILATARGGHGSHDGEVDRVLVFIAVGSAIAGGLLFAGLDKLLSSHGAFLRKAATVRTYVGQVRYALTRRLICRLQQVPMFEVLSVSELHRLARSMIKERYSAGSTIFHELHSDSSIFFLLYGRVELKLTHALASRHNLDDTSSNGTGEEVVDRFMLGPNDIFGEMALFSSETVQAQAVALSPSCVLRIPSTALHRMLASNKRLQDFVAMITIDRLRETDIFCRCTPSTVARLVSFMKQGEYDAGDVMFFDIDQTCPIYFIVLGSVEVIYPAKSVSGEVDGGIRSRVICANELLGTEHLVMGSPIHAKAVALERTAVLIIQRSDIDTLCQSDARFREALLTSGQTGVPVSAGYGTIPLERHSITTEQNDQGKTGNYFLDEYGKTLVPPEGMEAPSKFGCTTAEIGWTRHMPGSVGGISDTILQAPKDHREGTSTMHPTKMMSRQASKLSHASDEYDDPFKEEVLADSDLLQTADALAAAAKGVEGDAADGNDHGHAHGRGVQAAIMIWLGILIDSVPESLVMGIMVTGAPTSSLVTFVSGVFLANFPEAMSSAGTMCQHGMRKSVVMSMWASICLLTGVGAFTGAFVFPPGSKEDPDLQKLIAGIEGLCGGAMLTMIANTVLPEAFEEGGNVTGLSTLMGFLSAITVSVII